MSLEVVKWSSNGVAPPCISRWLKPDQFKLNRFPAWSFGGPKKERAMENYSTVKSAQRLSATSSIRLSRHIFVIDV